MSFVFFSCSFFGQQFFPTTKKFPNLQKISLFFIAFLCHPPNAYCASRFSFTGFSCILFVCCFEDSPKGVENLLSFSWYLCILSSDRYDGLFIGCTGALSSSLRRTRHTLPDPPAAPPVPGPWPASEGAKQLDGVIFLSEARLILVHLQETIDNLQQVRGWLPPPPHPPNVQGEVYLLTVFFIQQFKDTQKTLCSPLVSF